jgi:hypothetical protein
MIPKIKKSIKKFLLDESGKVSKKSLLRIGVGVVMLAGTSIQVRGDELTSGTWYNSAVDGDSCKCTRTVGGTTWTDNWDKFKEFVEVSPNSEECSCDYDSSGCNERSVAAHANVNFEANLGGFAGSDSDENSEENCGYGSVSTTAEISMSTPAGIHDNYIALSEEEGTKIVANHNNAITELDLTIKQTAKYHDSMASW